MRPASLPQRMRSCSAVQPVLDGTCKHMVHQLGALVPRDGIFITHPNIMEECGSHASWSAFRFPAACNSHATHSVSIVFHIHVPRLHPQA